MNDNHSNQNPTQTEIQTESLKALSHTNAEYKTIIQHLGHASAYVSTYDASLLNPIPRNLQRQTLQGVKNAKTTFTGMDIWNAYEFSWLNSKGKPHVALLQVHVPADSPNLIESKSFKLYLNSYQQTRFNELNNLKQTLLNDLSQACGAQVFVQLQEIALMNTQTMRFKQFTGYCLDWLDVEIEIHNQPNINYLNNLDEWANDYTVYSHLLKSNCLMTNQPDWASVSINYTGKKINEEGLLKYLISFREHQEFHEHCVERIFCDLMTHCNLQYLTVYAQYTRRGGLDINPFRSNQNQTLPEFIRHVRQ